MATKLIILAAAFTATLAVPVWIDGEGVVPGVVMRIGRSPNMAFGFGSGFSSSIGGISHSTGIGSSFQSGGAQAYGSGFGSAGAGNGGAFARGVGMAASAPAPYPYQQSLASAYNTPLARNNYGSAVSSVQNFGGYGSASSAAKTQNGLQYGSAASAAQNMGRYQSAVSSAQNMRGLGYDSAVSAAQSNNGFGMEYGSAAAAAENAGDYGSAVSSTHSHDGHNNFDAAVSAAQNIGGYRGSSAQTIQQRGASVRNSGASSINGPGIQAAQSHAIDTGNYY